MQKEEIRKVCVCVCVCSNLSVKLSVDSEWQTCGCDVL